MHGEEEAGENRGRKREAPKDKDEEPRSGGVEDDIRKVVTERPNPPRNGARPRMRCEARDSTAGSHPARTRCAAGRRACAAPASSRARRRPRGSRRGAPEGTRRAPRQGTRPPAQRPRDPQGRVSPIGRRREAPRGNSAGIAKKGQVPRSRAVVDAGLSPLGSRSPLAGMLKT